MSINKLTPRQFEVSQLVSAGMSNKEIAGKIGIFDGTVKVHIKAIMLKLGVNNRVKVARLIWEHTLSGGANPVTTLASSPGAEIVSAPWLARRDIHGAQVERLPAPKLVVEDDRPKSGDVGVTLGEFFARENSIATHKKEETWLEQRDRDIILPRYKYADT